jgi:hyperosmotically inducible protein
MKRIIFALLLPACVAGCDTKMGSGSAGSYGSAARDNTAVNVRDRDAANKTPINQNENKTDIDITAEIRRQVVDTKMSIDAQNVKIMTQDGRVTLRGPVKTAEEKTQIVDIARRVAGADRVEDQLEVAAAR